MGIRTSPTDYVYKGLRNLAQYGGTIRYVSDATGSNTNAGTDPLAPKKTIGAAIAASSAGDAISVTSGTYTEVGLNLNLFALEIWFELGVVLAPASGTVLTVTGESCMVYGAVKLTPVDGETGLLIDTTATNCHVTGLRVPCGGLGDCGLDIAGNRAKLTDVGVCDMKAAGEKCGLKIRANDVHIHHVHVRGNAATIGVWIASGDNAFIQDGNTLGNTVAGYQIDTGVTHSIIKDCATGNSDGRWTDVDNQAVWINFEYGDKVYTTCIFNGAGSFKNLFKVTGAVSIQRIYGDVTTALNADVGACKFEFDDGTSQTNITAAVDISSAPLESFVGKTGALGAAIDYKSSATGQLIDWIADLSAGFTVTAKRGATNYIRFNNAGVATDGAIHFHCWWTPLSEDGFVEPA